MNPLVSDMLDIVAGQDTDLMFLEELLNDDCKCESIHNLTQCSVKVVAKITSCTVPWTLKCANGLRYSRQFMAEGGGCSGCHELASDCWTIRPI